MSQQTPPAAAAIEALLLQVGQQQLRVNGETLSVMKLADVALDFSSIAKGFGVDQVADWLDPRASCATWWKWVARCACRVSAHAATPGMWR